MALFPSDLWCEGKPFEACSRNILNRQIARAEAMGFTMNMGIEAEFFVFRDEPQGRNPVSPLEHLEKPAYDTTRLMDNFHWLGELVDAMNDLGWDVYSFDHEDGIGQVEILDGTVLNHRAQGTEALPGEDVEQDLECRTR